MKIKKILSLFLLFIVLSCHTDNRDDEFIKLIIQEGRNNPYNVFNPSSAILVSVLPDRLGTFKADGKIKNQEILVNGSGYSKGYKNTLFKNKGYYTTIYVYHAKQRTISEDIGDSMVYITYEDMKEKLLKFYENSKILTEDTIIFTTPSNRILKMKEIIFEYLDPVINRNIRSYIYFTSTFNTYVRVKISYDKEDSNISDIFEDKELFLKDFAFFIAEDLSTKNFDEFKQSNKENLVKIQRIKNDI